MRTIELAKNRVELLQIIESAQSEPVLLITDSGQEFIMPPQKNLWVVSGHGKSPNV